jgi:hypothetical protein
LVADPAGPDPQQISNVCKLLCKLFWTRDVYLSIAELTYSCRLIILSVLATLHEYLLLNVLKLGCL